MEQEQRRFSSPFWLETIGENPAFERLYPFFCAFFFTLFLYWLDALPNIPNASALYDKTVDIAAIAVGFLTTVKTILLSIQDKLIIKQMKDSGHYDKFVHFISQAIWLCALTVVATVIGIYHLPDEAQVNSIVSLFFPAIGQHASPHISFKPIFLLISFFATWSLFACYRVFDLITHILRQAK